MEKAHGIRGTTGLLLVVALFMLAFSFVQLPFGVPMGAFLSGDFSDVQVPVPVGFDNRSYGSSETQASPEGITQEFDSSFDEVTDAESVTVQAGEEACVEDPWLNGFPRRKAITISNPGSSQTNYQVNVTVAYDSDMQSDFDDIRFTRSDGVTLLDHWRENYTSSSSALFWVEVNSIPNGDSTIYMYYDNDAAGSESNGTNTFLFFDDFNRDNSSSVGNGWTEDVDIGSIAGNNLKILGTGGTSEAFAVWKDFTASDSLILETYCTPPTIGSGDSHYFHLFGDDNNERVGIVMGDCGGGTNHFCYLNSAGWNFMQDYTSGTTYKLEIRYNFSSNRVAYYIDNSLKASGQIPYTSTTMDRVTFGAYGTTTTVYWDNLISRKYTSPEPTASVGSEDPLVTQAGSAASWTWKVPSSGDKVKSNSPTSWTWVDFAEGGADLTVPRGSAGSWDWGP